MSQASRILMVFLDPEGQRKTFLFVVSVLSKCFFCSDVWILRFGWLPRLIVGRIFLSCPWSCENGDRVIKR